MDLAEQISRTSGKQTGMLRRIADQLPKTPATCDALIALAESGEPRLQSAATWILKNLQERGARFRPAQVNALVKLLASCQDWNAELHLLQMAASWTIPAPSSVLLRTAALRRTEHVKPFVRAWAYNTLAVLAAHFPEYRHELAEHIERGRADPAASVRARLRHVERPK